MTLLLLALFSSGTLAVLTGCPPPNPVDAGPGDGDGDGDGDDEISAVITADASVRLGGDLEFSAGDTQNPAGRALTYAWSVVEEPEAGCAGEFSPNGAVVSVTLSPTCLGSYRVLLDVSTVSETEPVSSVFATFDVIRPENHIVNIAEVTGRLLRGFPFALDGSATIAASDETLSYAWTVVEPLGDACGTGAFDDATSVTPNFTASCPGPHTFTLTVSDSLTSSAAEASVSVDASLIVSFGMVAEVAFPNASIVDLELDPLSVPDDVADDVIFALTTEPLNQHLPAVVTVDEDDTARFSVVPGSPRGRYTLVGTASVGGVTSAPIETTLDVPNGPPTIGSMMPMVGDFNTGDTMVGVTVMVADPDGDDLTCTARILDSQGTPVATTPSVVSSEVADGVCTIVVDTSGASDQAWQIEITVEDIADGTATVVGPFFPNNEAPTIEPIATPASVGYSCDASTCTSDPVTVSVVAADSLTTPEELTYAFAIANAPAGAEAVTVSAMPGSAANTFDLVFTRPSLGTMTAPSAFYDLVVTVTDTPIADGLNTESTEAAFQAQILSASPTIESFSLTGNPEMDHTYDQATQRYNATVTTTFAGNDDENNTIALGASVTACPGGDCVTGTTIEITAGDGSDGSYTALLSAPVIGDTVGAYEITLTVTDADGNVGVETVDFTVGNTPPAVSGLLMSTVNHTYNNGDFDFVFGYQGALGAATDDDGDPLSYASLNMACPGSTSNVTVGSPFVCSNAAFSFAGANLNMSTSSTALADGAIYTLSGTVSDGADAATQPAYLHRWNAEDRPPVFGNPFSGGNLTADHLYVGGNIELETPLTLSGNVSDPDGDPLTPIASVTSDATCSTTTAWISPGSTMSLQVTCPWASRASPKTNQPGVSSPFGDHNESATFSLRFENRLPTVNSVEWRHQDGAVPQPYAYFPAGSGGNSTPYFERHLSVTEGGQDKARQYQKPIDISHLDARCTDPNFWFPGGPFGLFIDVTDPDNDPVSAGFDFDCGDNEVFRPEAQIQGQTCTGLVFESTATKRSVPQDGLFPFQVMRPASEDADICHIAAPVTYRQQDLFDNHPSRNAVRCTMENSSEVTDSWGTTDVSIPSMQRHFDWSDPSWSCWAN